MSDIVDYEKKLEAISQQYYVKTYYELCNARKRVVEEAVLLRENEKNKK